MLPCPSPLRAAHALALALAIAGGGLALAPRPASAALQLPANMSKGDREEALRVFGLGTSPKMLTDPYPLGGYSGLELGASLVSLPVQEIGNMGAGVSSPQQNATFATISVGKGLYHDVDFFIAFTPYQTQTAEFTEFGGILRWCFYQGAAAPFTLSAAAQLGGVNVRDEITAQSIGIDLIAGLTVGDVSRYAGAGPAQAQGAFLGGAGGVTDGDKSPQTEQVASLHEVIGASVRQREAFIAVEIDRYSDIVFSGKLGLRF
jgi:hypothetical protein